MCTGVPSDPFGPCGAACSQLEASHVRLVTTYPLIVTRPRAAGWRSDPARGHEFRYWDGAQWTVNVSDAGRQALDNLFEPFLPVRVPFWRCLRAAWRTCPWLPTLVMIPSYVAIKTLAWWVQGVPANVLADAEFEGWQERSRHSVPWNTGPTQRPKHDQP